MAGFLVRASVQTYQATFKPGATSDLIGSKEVIIQRLTGKQVCFLTLFGHSSMSKHPKLHARPRSQTSPDVFAMTTRRL